MIIRISDRKDFPAEWTDNRDDVVMSNPRIGLIQHVISCGSAGRPKYDQPILVTHGGVVCVARDREHNIAIINRYREVCVPPDAPRAAPIVDGSVCGMKSIEFPRGGCEDDEAGLTAALRETEEETGFIATGGKRLGSINADTAFFPYCHEVYLVEIEPDRPSSKPIDPNEEIEVALVRLSELLSWVGDGKVVCGLTQAALSAYLASLASQGDLSMELNR